MIILIEYRSYDSCDATTSTKLITGEEADTFGDGVGEGEGVSGPAIKYLKSSDGVLKGNGVRAV